jgi:hypothetical protein
MHRRLSYANVVATLALFVALGGSSYAAIKITGKNVKNGSLTGADVRNGSLTGGDVKNGSLGPADFSGSVRGPQGEVGPRGPKGDAGARGEQGQKGDPGVPATVTGGDFSIGDMAFPSCGAGRGVHLLAIDRPRLVFVTGSASNTGTTPVVMRASLGSSQLAVHLATGEQRILSGHFPLPAGATQDLLFNVENDQQLCTGFAVTGASLRYDIIEATAPPPPPPSGGPE